jgi:hypothetical protein
VAAIGEYYKDKESYASALYTATLFSQLFPQKNKEERELLFECVFLDDMMHEGFAEII